MTTVSITFKSAAAELKFFFIRHILIAFEIRQDS